MSSEEATGVLRPPLVLHSYVSAARKTIPSVLGVARLATVFRSVGVAAYADYLDPKASPPFSFSGWHTRVSFLRNFALWRSPVYHPTSHAGARHPPLYNCHATGSRWSFLSRRHQDGDCRAAQGVKWSEVSTAALSSQAPPCQVVTRKTIVLWFAAAHPNARPASDESKALGPDACDWVALCRRLAAAHVTVYPVLSSDATGAALRAFTFAAAVTGGACVVTPDASTSSTTRTTINLLVGAAADQGSTRALYMHAHRPPAPSYRWRSWARPTTKEPGRASLTATQMQLECLS